MDEIEKYLIEQIEICGNDMTMEGEKHAFECTLKKVKEQQLAIQRVSQQHEPLNGFRQWLIDEKKNIYIYQQLIDEYLNTI